MEINDGFMEYFYAFVLCGSCGVFALLERRFGVLIRVFCLTLR
jgi:hypothetical protein